MLLSGNVPATDTDGSAWDPFGGLPDPKFCFEFGGAAGGFICGPSASNTTTPVWNAKIVTNAPSYSVTSNHWRMFDADVTSLGDDDIGRGCNETAQTWTDADVFDGNVRTFTCTMANDYYGGGGYGGNWSVRFKVVPHTP